MYSIQLNLLGDNQEIPEQKTLKMIVAKTQPTLGYPFVSWERQLSLKIEMQSSNLMDPSTMGYCTMLMWIIVQISTQIKQKPLPIQKQRHKELKRFEWT